VSTKITVFRDRASCGVQFFGASFIVEDRQK
jgi:hypothetical protein